MTEEETIQLSERQQTPWAELKNQPLTVWVQGPDRTLRPKTMTWGQFMAEVDAPEARTANSRKPLLSRRGMSRKLQRRARKRS
jgi:hypothetical protein